MADPVQVVPAKKVMRTLYALCALVFVLGVFTVRSEIRDSDRIDEIHRVQVEGRAETQQRIDQACTIFEQQHKDDVDRLRDTYKYLADLKPSELDERLNSAILTNLPNVIREAKTDDAPEYCDAPGVGLPEPDPVLPERPKNLPAP